MEYKFVEGDKVFASQKQNEPYNPNLGLGKFDPMKRERMRRAMMELQAELEGEDKQAESKGQD